jgi:hypothetical protein
MIASLLEYASSAGPRPVIRAQMTYPANEARPMCSTEILVQGSDFPDFLRQRLWETIHARQGQLSITSQQNGCRIMFALPVERRLGTILG